MYELLVGIRAPQRLSVSHNTYVFMNYNTKATEIVLTPAITAYLEKKMTNLDRFVPESLRDALVCYVELGKNTNHHKNGDLFLTEIHIKSGLASFYTKSEEPDLYAAIDISSAEMAESLRAFKSKKQGLFKKGGVKIKSLLRNLYGSDQE